MTPKEIGVILQKAREKKGITTDKVYKATRIAPSIVRSIEEGKAHETLNRIYLLLFVKNYAHFLNIDPTEIIKDYKSFYKNEEKQVFDIKPEPLMVDVDIQKWLVFIGVAIVSIVTIFFVLLLGMKVKSFYNSRKISSKIATTTQKAVTKKTENAVFPIADEKGIDLALESTDDVWMRVTKDGALAFDGTLQKGRTMSWKADKKISLWVGRAEALKFTINGQKLKDIGKGAIRNIDISKEGLKIGNNWLFK